MADTHPYRASLLWAIFILILCGVPGTEFPKLTFLEWLRPDKIIHLVIFGIQSFLLIKSFRAQSRSVNLKEHSVLYAVIISIAYGALVEVMQTYIFIQRSGDVRDAIANALGAFTGIWLFKKYGHRQLRINKSFNFKR